MKQEYLINISIGPVQNFIAAARKTSDFYIGSMLIQKISASVADNILSCGGKLIFPAISSKDRIREEKISNVILAKVETDNIEKYINLCKESASRKWDEYVSEAMLSGEKELFLEICHIQKKDVLEFYAAWVEINPKEDYFKKYNRLMEIFSARKNTRNFKSNQVLSNSGLSSLDGLGENVLKIKKPRFIQTKNENLDLMGVVKRYGGSKKSYPSIVEIATRPWLKKIYSDSTEKENVEFESILSKIPKSLKNNGGIYFIESKEEITSLLESEIIEEEIIEKYIDLLKKMRLKYGKPPKYLVLLKADGDKIGALISEAKTEEEHLEISQRLLEFSSCASTIIKKYNGELIYAGGDDVMAFLPLDTCFCCADKLQKTFQNCFSSFSKGEHIPTLSVGLATGHSMEDLYILKSNSDYAEYKAKEGDSVNNKRNALAVLIRSRGNAEQIIRTRWDEEIFQNPINKMERFNISQSLEWLITQFLENKIANSTPYEIKKTYDFYSNWNNKSILCFEFERILSRKEIDSDTCLILCDYLKNETIQTHNKYELFTQLLLISHWFSKALRGDSK